MVYRFIGMYIKNTTSPILELLDEPRNFLRLEVIFRVYQATGGRKPYLRFDKKLVDNIQ